MHGQPAARPPPRLREVSVHTSVTVPPDDRLLFSLSLGEQGIRFLLVSGKPLEEPVAWYGPIVVNTEAELKRAFAELHNGTFLKHQGGTRSGAASSRGRGRRRVRSV
jgi:hypothetical protein